MYAKWDSVPVGRKWRLDCSYIFVSNNTYFTSQFVLPAYVRMSLEYRGWPSGVWVQVDQNGEISEALGMGGGVAQVMLQGSDTQVLQVLSLKDATVLTKAMVWRVTTISLNIPTHDTRAHLYEDWPVSLVGGQSWSLTNTQSSYAMRATNIVMKSQDVVACFLNTSLIPLNSHLAEYLLGVVRFWLPLRRDIW